jgi:hypothetical protein
MRDYDVSKAFRDPSRAERLRKGGYTIRIFEGEGAEEKTVDEYVVTPEEVAAYDERRRKHRVQN